MVTAIKANSVIFGICLILLAVIVACGEDATPTSAPTAAPVDTEAIVQRAVEAALAQFPTPAPGGAGPTAEQVVGQVQAAVQAAVAAIPAPAPGAPGPSAAEIAAQVQAAVTAAAPEGTSPEQIQAMVEAAIPTVVASRVTPLATPASTPAPVGKVEPFGVLDVGQRDLSTPIFVLKNQSWIPGRFDNATTHETMFRFAPDGSINNELVTDWSVDSTGLVYTFNLRQGVKWHGSWGEFTADDFIWSIENVATPGSRHTTGGNTRRVWLCEGCKLTKIDDYTVQWDRPEPTFEVTWHTTAPSDSYSFHSKLHFDTVGEEAANHQSIGTGPWEMVDAEVQQFRKMRAFRDHWRKVPEFDEFILWEIPEESTRLANFLVGRLDTANLNPESIDAIKNEGRDDIKFKIIPGGGVVLMMMSGMQHNLNHPSHVGDNAQVPVSPDVFDCTPAYVSCSADLNSQEWVNARKVREAMTLSIDRQKLVNNLVGGEGAPAYHYWLGSPDREKQFGLDKWTREYDLGRAKQLLAEAGYPNGFDINVIMIGRSDEAGEPVSVMWQDIGINPTIERLPYSAVRPSQVSRQIKGIHPYGIGPVDNRLKTYNIYYNSKTTFNFGFEHPVLQEMLDDALTTLDDEERWVKTAGIAKFLFDNVIYHPLYTFNRIWPLGPAIGDWEVSLFDLDRMTYCENVPHRQ